MDGLPKVLQLDKLKWMDIPAEFLRGVLGILALGCAHMAGRSLVAVRSGRQKISKLYGWVIRTVVCLAAIAFRHPVDAVDLAIWALAAAALAAGYWVASHPKEQEDLTDEIFPEAGEEEKR